MEQNEIRCPKCNSNQLTANKKGFSGTKAVVGGLLTGGVGLLAGTIGSNKVIITCLACGNTFKPGEGKVVSNEPIKKVEPDLNEIRLQELIARKEQEKKEQEKFIEPENNIDPMDTQLFKILKEGFVRGAIYHYRTKEKVSKEEATDYVEKLIVENNLSDKVKRKGCFVATACYGDYDAPEVLLLRKYRDEKLVATKFGRILVEIYYLISPFFARLIENSEFLKRIVKKYLLHKLIMNLSTSNEKRF